jgi:hypothetical protein
MTVGYVKAVYSQYDHEKGHWVHAYLPEDFDKIAAGYACGHCGEDYMGVYRTRCPVCGFTTLSTEERVGDPVKWGPRNV